MEKIEALRWIGDGTNRRLEWQEISAKEAISVGELQPRCPECKQPVRLHAASVDGMMAAHAEQRRASSKCSLSAASKEGYGGNH